MITNAGITDWTASSNDYYAQAAQQGCHAGWPPALKPSSTRLVRGALIQGQDMDNAEKLLSACTPAILSQAARGEIDLNELAHQELASRGLNSKGENVGAMAAHNEWLDAYGGDPDGAKKFAWCEGCNDVLLPIGRMCKCGVINTGGDA